MVDIHAEAMAEFDKIQSAMQNERLQCLQDRRFYSIAGAQWEGPLGEQFENRPKMEVNKIALAIQRIFSEYRSNRITVNFVSKEGKEHDSLAETCNKLYRADEQDSAAEEAFDNAFEEAVGGGFGAWRLRACYENEEDDSETQRIRIEPIYDADSSVFFDLQAKRQDKADATRCFVLSSMTHDAYIEQWNDDPATWPKEIQQLQFDWSTPDVVYVAEYYRVETVSTAVRVFENEDEEEEKYTDEQLTDTKILELKVGGYKEKRKKKINKRKVHKYILSGNKILEDCGYIAGKYIPIVPVYGKRWFIDNIERCAGHVRIAKDAQRLANMQRSKLAEISAISSVEKPIFVPEQVSGHQNMWAEDNIKNYPYLLVNPVTGPDGSSAPAGAVGYTKSPEIPPALAALLQMSEADIRDVLGNQEQGDKITANVSGKAVEMVQNRLDTQTFIYVSNHAKAKQHGGVIYLSMAKEVYVEPNRKMKGVNSQGKTEPIELLKPILNEEGELEFENDISKADFDVFVDVGPSSSSKRAAIVRSITQMMAVTQDPEVIKVLTATALHNMEGEGLGDLREFYRRQLVTMGVIKPTEEEAKAMEEQANQPDPNEIYIQAIAEESLAKAEKARADIVETIASADLKQAQMVKTLSEAGQTAVAAEESQQTMQPVAQQSAAPQEMNRREMLELESMQLENALKSQKVESVDIEIQRLREELKANNQINESAINIQNAVQQLEQTALNINAATENLSEVMTRFIENSNKNAEKALEFISKPKRIVREKGKIVRIETEH